MTPSPTNTADLGDLVARARADWQRDFNTHPASWAGNYAGALLDLITAQQREIEELRAELKGAEEDIEQKEVELGDADKDLAEARKETEALVKERDEAKNGEGMRERALRELARALSDQLSEATARAEKAEALLVPTADWINNYIPAGTKGDAEGGL